MSLAHPADTPTTDRPRLVVGRPGSREAAAATSVAQRESWRTNREARRLATLKGHIRGLLTDYPERLGEVLATVAEAVTPQRGEP